MTIVEAKRKRYIEVMEVGSRKQLVLSGIANLHITIVVHLYGMADVYNVAVWKGPIVRVEVNPSRCIEYVNPVQPSTYCCTCIRQ